MDRRESDSMDPFGEKASMVEDDWTDLGDDKSPSTQFVNVSRVDDDVLMSSRMFTESSDNHPLPLDLSSSIDQQGSQAGSLPRDNLFPADQDDDQPGCPESKSLPGDDDLSEEDEDPIRGGCVYQAMDDDASLCDERSSPLVREDYIRDMSLVEPEDESDVPVKVDPMDEVVSLVEILRSDPSACQTKSTVSDIPQCSCDFDKDASPSVKSTFVVIVLLIFSWFYRPRSHTHVEIPNGLTDLDLSINFFNSFAREVSSCEGMCCFSLFILTGDNTAHNDVLRDAMRRTKRFSYKQRFDRWSASRLIKWTESYNDKEPESPVVLVENADELDTREVQRVIKFGQRRCRDPRNASPSKIVVLSTSFGSERLNDPDEVLSDRFVDDFKRRDWLAVPEIVLNRHGIIHGIRGKRPQRVFADFLSAHRKVATARQASLGLFARWLRRTDEAPNDRDDKIKQLDNWLDTKRSMFAWTDSAKQVLINRVQQIDSFSKARFWLENQYSLWTRNGSCESVLFKSSPTDVRAFNVACDSKALGGGGVKF